ncbi:hypothetical protein BJX99DRAFT_222551 [Aspergillus californicus]
MSQSNYYVVYKGRVNSPTIFSSWAQVHPRVTGYNGADHQGFDTLQDARSSLQERGFSEFSAVVESNSRSTTSTRRPKKFYAVAYGRTTGVFEDYRWLPKDSSQHATRVLRLGRRLKGSLTSGGPPIVRFSKKA